MQPEFLRQIPLQILHDRGDMVRAGRGRKTIPNCIRCGQGQRLRGKHALEIRSMLFHFHRHTGVRGGEIHEVFGTPFTSLLGTFPGHERTPH